MTKSTTSADQDWARIERACRSVMDQPARVADMAAASGWSLAHFQRQFKARLGISPGEFLRGRRLNQFTALLREGVSVTEAMHAVGYGSSSRAHQATGEGMGMSAVRYRQQGQGLVVQYALADSTLGRVLVAATERGLCAILLGESDTALIDELRQRFARATVCLAEDDFQATLTTVLGMLDLTQSSHESLPLDVIGTAFQRRVWQALQRIPSGQTMTYTELARVIDQPRAARAVAAACAANPLAVVVPCHRIVRADGGLGGYRWGLARKEQLLAREQV
ncbi:MAG: methylated-DNA--[protein]-cysteine S-methyltransferase [Pseudomonadota bacterium]